MNRPASPLPLARSLTLFLGLALLAGCSGDADSDAAASGEGATLGGVVSLDGSSTVYPISEAVAEEFMTEAPRVRVTVGVSGTGGGFKKFLASEIDIND